MTRLAIFANVPSGSGVFALQQDDTPLFFGESWNLRARLLELVAIVEHQSGSWSVTYELCSEEEMESRRDALAAEYLPSDLESTFASAPGVIIRARV